MAPSYELPMPEAEYFTIESALMATHRGRQFLRAFLERNQRVETFKLLQSIAKLHKVAAGEPDFAGSIHRELTGLLHNMRDLKKMAEQEKLNTGLQQLEASLLALTEAVEERWTEQKQKFRDRSTPTPFLEQEQGNKLYAELASLFSSPRMAKSAE